MQTGLSNPIQPKQPHRKRPSQPNNYPSEIPRPKNPQVRVQPDGQCAARKQTPAAIHPVFSNADFSPHSAFAADDKPKSAIAGVAPPNSPEIFQKQTSQPPAVNPEITQSSKAEIAAYAGPIHTTLKPLPQAEIFLQARSRVIQTPHVTFAEAEKSASGKNAKLVPLACMAFTAPTL
ncbi:MAG: hypothetical protein IPK76_03460 [Lewinellaceae bacterium]|nr:hypothetical protein [Lewinellaceae bacterium]